MQLNNLRIGARLGLGFAAVLALMLAIVAVARQRLDDAAVALQTMSALQQEARISQEWLGKTELNMARTLAIAKAAGQPDIEQHFAPLIKQTSAEIGALQREIAAQMSAPAAKALWDAIAEKRLVYTGLRTRMLELIQQADQPAADALLNERLMPAAAAYQSAVAAVCKHQVEQAALGVTQLRAAMQRSDHQLLGLLAAGLVLGAVLAWLITRSVTTPLGAALRTARVIAASDLSQPVGSDRGDELGDLLRALGQMQASLRGVVGQVRASTERIGTASGEISSGNLDLSGRTEETASNLQQTASSMALLTDTVKSSAESARHASLLASSAAEVAGRGGAVVSQVVETMHGINESSRRIAEIVGVIDSIAFQTNILALNAAVEAARAGEQGRGFAVVATEVRQLAQRSAGAAREIKALIGASVERVEGGSRLVATAGATMTEIVGSVQRVSDMIHGITRATAEQSDGIVRISGSVDELDRMTQQNAALVEQSGAAAASLRQQADALAKLVGTFRLEPVAAAPLPA